MTIEMHQQGKMVSCESGQTMTEYSLVLGLIVLVTIATFTVLGGRVEQVLGLVLGIFSDRPPARRCGAPEPQGGAAPVTPHHAAHQTHGAAAP